MHSLPHSAQRLHKNRQAWLQRLFTAVLCLALVLAAPALAEARAGGSRSGGGASMGSRGARTYQSSPQNSPYQAKPIERSNTQPAAPATAPAPSSVNRPASPNAAPQPAAPRPSFFGSNPFLSSMAGGFLGAGLFGLLFNHGGGGMGSAASGGGAALGGILQLLLLAGLGFLAYRWFARRNSQSSPLLNNGYDSMPIHTMDNGAGFGAGSGATTPYASSFSPDTGSNLVLNDADLQAFEALLTSIQQSWSGADLGRMRGYVTPEMLQYFSEALAANTSRGEANHVEHVKLLSGNPIESWSEEELDYATVHMKWQAFDYTVRLDRKPTDADYLLDGSPTTPTEAEEIWTFAKANNGANDGANHGGNNGANTNTARWILSAIQQVA